MGLTVSSASHRTAKLLLLSGLVLLMCSGLAAQEVFIEHHGTGTSIIAVIPQKSFIFERNSSTSDYQVSIEVNDSKKKQVARHERNLSVPQIGELNTAAIMIEFQVQLAAGDYNLSMIIRNTKLGDRKTLTRPFEIRINSVQIGHAYLVGETQNVMYLLNSYDQLAYGFDRRYLYQNISVVVDSMKVNMQERVYTYKDLKSTNLIPLEFHETDQSIDSIQLSYYESNILYKAEPFLYGAWYSYGSTYSLKDQMDQLRYVATQNEWNTLRKIPSSRYFEAIEQFWEKYDPSPGTQRNEAREEFYRRVVTADEKFTIHARLKGWKSDRGRIYIKYGIPDEIVSEAYPLGLAPYIVWYYYAQNKRFVFVDTKGFGQYVLSNREEEYNGF